MDDKVESEIIAKGLVAIRVTPQMVDDAIVREYCFTADAATKEFPQVPALANLTICVLVLKNGFAVTGESACISPENFDLELGKKIARQKAKDKIYALEAYRLKSEGVASQ